MPSRTPVRAARCSVWRECCCAVETDSPWFRSIRLPSRSFPGLSASSVRPRRAKYHAYALLRPRLLCADKWRVPPVRHLLIGLMERAARRDNTRNQILRTKLPREKLASYGGTPHDPRRMTRNWPPEIVERTAGSVKSALVFFVCINGHDQGAPAARAWRRRDLLYDLAPNVTVSTVHKALRRRPLRVSGLALAPAQAAPGVYESNAGLRLPRRPALSRGDSVRVAPDAIDDAATRGRHHARWGMLHKIFFKRRPVLVRSTKTQSTNQTPRQPPPRPRRRARH